jgi:acetyl-CoA C-acetyltransferase
VYHAYGAYERWAWGLDVVRPLARRGAQHLCKSGETLVDSLDTLWIMGLKVGRGAGERGNICRIPFPSTAPQDEFAAASHAKAVAAQASGVFAEEIIPVTVAGRKGDTVVTKDEHPRADSTAEVLGKLKPIRLKQDPEATVTAGNASGQNDGASACLVMTREMAEQYGLKPLARLVSWAAGGVGPAVMGIGPVPSTDKALKRAGLSIKDIDLIELNEAFAAQVLACTKAMGFTEDDYARLNVHGSGISLGHPVGATGGRILATLLREMDRREARYGLETMCIGGGQGLAAVFERVS